MNTSIGTDKMADEDSVSSYSTAGSEDTEKTAYSPTIESGSNQPTWVQGQAAGETRYMAPTTPHLNQSTTSPAAATMSRLPQNPFAIKTAAAPRSLNDIAADSCKESRPILTPPTLRLGSDQSAVVTSSSSRILLRPSALSAQAEKLRFCQQGAPNKQEDNKENKALVTDADESKSKVANQKHLFALADSSSSTKSDDGTSNVAPSDFVFGQNLHERVVNYDQDGSPKADSSSSSSAANLSFQEAATKSESESSQDGISGRAVTKSLTESAEEIQSRQVKRKFSEVTVITGEEEESNVLQMNCKLFTFDNGTSSWQERGRGILRLNDREVDGVLHSRVVMRTQGSLRVVMNTKVWSGMSVEHPSQKTVRITAVDTEGVKVFLVMANPKDAEQLFSALDWRVATLKSQEESRGKMNNGISGSHSHHQEVPTHDTLSSARLPTSDSEDYSPTSKRHCTGDQQQQRHTLGADSTTSGDECPTSSSSNSKDDQHRQDEG